MIELRPEQIEARDKGLKALNTLGIVYLAMEVRTGKTLAALSIVHEMSLSSALFVTKKKAIPSVESDYRKSGYKFELDVINFESLHKVYRKYPIYIIDESHCLGAFPTPNKRTKQLQELIGKGYVILMSGTPTPETFSQIYHQFSISPLTPFYEYPNFYKWAKKYVSVYKRYVNSFQINQYDRISKENQKILEEILDPYMFRLSQKDAGFEMMVEEKVHYVKMDWKIDQLVKILTKKLLYQFKNGEDMLVADTPVRLQSYVHQIFSGTVKVSDDKRVILDKSKAYYIKKQFAGKKIAIFYKFIAEGDMLRSVFPNHTDSPEEFNNNDDMIFIGQVVSNREGTNLSSADYLIMFNIDFSATSYFQARARMQTKNRTKAATLIWLFALGGIESKIYEAVSRKKNYTLRYFKKDYGIK